MSKNPFQESKPQFDLSQLNMEPESEFSNLNTNFYDLILGEDDEDELAGLRSIEQEVVDQLQHVLESTEELSGYIPVLPKLITELLVILQEEHTDFARLANLVSQDIKLAIEIIRVANNPLFRRTAHHIESIQQAIQIIGLDNVASIATESVMKAVMHVKPVYFKWFGESIWVHARQCAAVCQYLSQGNNAFEAYLAGLAYDTGKIIIFKCLVTIVSKITSNELPHSSWFKRAMTEDSKWLSVLVAQEWQLPSEVISALEQQESVPESDLGKILYISNICSEISLFIRDGKMTHEEGEELLQSYGLSLPLINHLFQIMEAAVNKD